MALANACEALERDKAWQSSAAVPRKPGTGWSWRKSGDDEE